MAQQETVYQRGLRAKARLDQLGRSPDWVKRYAGNDPDAVDVWRELTNRMAEAMTQAKAEQAVVETQQYAGAGVTISQDPNAQAQALEANRQATDALVNDPDFQKRFNAGDAAALQQWRALSVDGTAKALGIPAQQATESAIGRGAEAKVQAEIAAPAASATGAA